MKLINFYAGPGTGKSTTAAQVFAGLKKKGYNVELVTEFAKELTWHDRHRTLTDQLYVTSKQHHNIYMLKDKVEYIVTDSPILLGLYYNKLNPTPMPNSFNHLLLDLWNEYDSIDIFLNRSKDYNPKGRNQTENEAKEIDTAIKRLLLEYKIPHWDFGTTDNDVAVIIENITNIKDR